MIKRTRDAVIVATILVVAVFSFLGLEGCGGGGDGVTCSPPAHFTTSPGRTAVVGQQYLYEVHAVYNCGLFVCGGWDPIQLPPGAWVQHPFIIWTPTPSQANRNFRFTIETGRDSCGQTATQSWTVHVSPAAAVLLNVTSVSPRNGASNIPTNSIITAWFSVQIDPQTVTSSSFLVSASSGSIAGTLKVTGNAITFTPSFTLTVSTITVTITTAVKDLAGNALASNYTWTFLADVPFDTTPPSTPTSLIGTRITASQVDVVWGRSSDDYGVAGYKLYRDGIYVPNTVVPYGGAYVGTRDAGLEFNTQYSYTVSAYDSSGNESVVSQPISVTTQDVLPGNAAGWGYAYDTFGVWARTIPDMVIGGYGGCTIWAPYLYCPGVAVGLSNISAMSLEGDQGLAVLSDGTVREWNARLEALPSSRIALSNVIAVAGGDSHALAIQSDGTVWGWGDNSGGQLGDGTTNSASTPVQMVNVSQAAAVAGGFSHSLILKSDGTVWATGGNSLGQLGDGTTNGHTTVNQVPTLSNIIAIAASANQSLALKADGTVWAWGGTDPSSYHSPPTLVAGISNVSAISQGRGFALAIKTDGTVWAWGSNSDGQLGDGTNTDRTVPVQVMGLTNVMTVAAGYYHALALRADGTVWAWGSNSDGQLGNGTTISNNVPVQVLRLTQIKAIAAGWRTSMALK